MSIVISTAWSGSLPNTKDELIAKVCALHGFSASDPALYGRALEWLDDSIRDLNHNVWQSTLIKEEGIAITQNQQYVTLPAMCYKESQAYLHTVGDGDKPMLKFMPWVHFKRMYPGTAVNTAGRPSVYSIFNLERESKLYFYPLPDATTATDYTLSVEYYQRLPRLSLVDGTSSIQIPEEFEIVILYGAYKRFAMHLGHAEQVSMYSNLEREALERIKQIDSMRPDADRRFRLQDEFLQIRWTSNPMYVFPY